MFQDDLHVVVRLSGFLKHLIMCMIACEFHDLRVMFIIYTMVRKLPKRFSRFEGCS